MKRLVSLLRGKRGRGLPALGPELEGLIATVREANLTYCGKPKLENLARAARAVVNDGVPGDFLEAGVALGGSAIVLAQLKEPTRSLYLYDVFEMIPPPGSQDGPDAHERYAAIVSGRSQGLGGDKYYGYVDGLDEMVRGNLTRYGFAPEQHSIRLVPGRFEETLHPTDPVAFAHIDCDWYESVRVCVERIVPNLSIGGVIGFDDYSSNSGCRRAVDELLQARSDLEVLYRDRSIGLRRKV